MQTVVGFSVAHTGQSSRPGRSSDSVGSWVFKNLHLDVRSVLSCSVIRQSLVEIPA